MKNCPYCGEEIKDNAKKCRYCGEWLEDNFSESGTTIVNVFASQYEVIEEVGRGGMAIVYKARQKSLDRIVALKVVPKEFTHDKEFVARFKKEARDGAMLSHTNIITIFDSGELAGYPYMSMEFIDGPTLSHEIKSRQNNFSEQEIKDILIPVLNGLGHAHEKGVIHRDIKSSNIMFDSTGRPVLMDFGIAKSMDGTRMTKTGTYMGTPEYSSPEQADTQKTIDRRTDIYSMGVVAYEMATGSVPFRGENPMAVLMDVISRNPKDLLEIVDGLSKGFANAVMRALEKDPDKRFKDCAAFVHALTSDKVIPIAEPSRAKSKKIEVKATNDNTEVKKSIGRSNGNKKKVLLGAIAFTFIISLGLIMYYFLFQGSGAKTIETQESQTINQNQANTDRKQSPGANSNIIESPESKIYTIFFTATIESGWFLYSQDNELSPPKMTIDFKESENFDFKGEMIFPKSISKWDPGFEMKMNFYKGFAMFIQSVEVPANDGAVLNGSIEFMCMDNKRVLPPNTVNFEFPLADGLKRDIDYEQTGKYNSIVTWKVEVRESTRIGSVEWSDGRILSSDSLFDAAINNIKSNGCIACHTFGNGKLIGPDLSDVRQRYDMDWLVKFVKDPAHTKFPEAQESSYPKGIMPSFDLSDDDIMGIMYIIGMSGNNMPL